MNAAKEDLVIFTATLMFLLVCTAFYEKLFILLIILYASLVAFFKGTSAKQRSNLFDCCAEFFESMKN